MINNSSISEILNLFTNFFKNINAIQENLENNTFENLVSKYISEIEDTLKIEDDKYNFQIISSDQQDEYDNISYINLGECENRMKAQKNINVSLIIAKMDIKKDF